MKQDLETFDIEKPKKTQQTRQKVAGKTQKLETSHVSRDLDNVMRGILPKSKKLGDNENELVVYGQNPSVLKSLLADNQVNPSARDSMALRVACKMGIIESVKMLIDAGCDPAAHDNEAIIWAAENGYDDIVELLILQYNTDPSAQKNKARAFAEKYKHDRVLKVLMRDARVSGFQGDSDTDTQMALSLIY